MKRLTLIALTLLSVGCGLNDPYSTEKAHFIAYNYLQYDEVEVNVDGASDIATLKKSVVPGIPTEFEVEIKVPKPARNDYYPTSPSSDDRTVNLSVNFRITRTGASTSPLTCRAGAKLTTRVQIKPLDATRVETKCDNP